MGGRYGDAYYNHCVIENNIWDGYDGNDPDDIKDTFEKSELLLLKEMMPKGQNQDRNTVTF